MSLIKFVRVHVRARAYAQVDAIPKAVDESWWICGQVSACRRFGQLWTGDARTTFSCSEVIRSDSRLDNLPADLQTVLLKGCVQIAGDVVLYLEIVDLPCRLHQDTCLI
jgi:hypothetical protein